jgi:hypothetical protein
MGQIRVRNRAQPRREAVVDFLRLDVPRTTLLRRSRTVAALLGLTRFQLYTRLKRYGIEVSPD